LGCATLSRRRTVGDVPDDVALGDDPDRCLPTVDDDESVDVLKHQLPGGFIERR
jgi:hypothetical protein